MRTLGHLSRSSEHPQIRLDRTPEKVATHVSACRWLGPTQEEHNKSRTVVPMLEHDSNAAGRARQNVRDARVQEWQAVYPASLAPIDHDDRCARTWFVVPHVDPEALLERRVGGIVKVVERLCERLNRELGRDANGKR